jgi:hypothetical protein
MTDKYSAMINTVLAKAPEWIRSEFASRDSSARSRAEEALAAMIAAALGSAH